MADYLKYRLWWEPQFMVSSNGIARGYPAGYWIPTRHTCKARTEEEAMTWGRNFFIDAEATGGMGMRVDTVAYLTESLVSDIVRVREAAFAAFEEIMEEE